MAMVTTTNKHMHMDRYMEISKEQVRGLVGGEEGKKVTRHQRDTFHLLMTTRRTLLEDTKDRGRMETLILSMNMRMMKNRVSMGSRVSMMMRRGLKDNMRTVRTILTTMMRNHCQQETMLRKKSLKQHTMKMKEILL